MTFKLTMIGLWVIQALMALAMVGPGVQKFTSPVWQRMFRVWGYPDHFYSSSAPSRLSRASACWCHASPRLRDRADVRHGGRVVTQMTHGASGIGEIVFMTMLGVIAYARRPASMLAQVRASGMAPVR